MWSCTCAASACILRSRCISHDSAVPTCGSLHHHLQELIAAKLALAQCAEREVIWRREMFKARQTNKQLAEKMGKLESLVTLIVDDA
jgi:hypothetical protein